MSIKKIALITGAAGQAGSAIVNRMKSDGYHTVGIDLKENGADTSIVCDVTKRKEMIKVAEKIEKEIGTISVLFTAAGADVCLGFEDVPISDWQKMLDVWLRGTQNACITVAPQMIKRGEGRIMALSADYAHSKENHILDAAASSSVHGFIKSFACEVAPSGVIANILFASVPFDLEAITATGSFLANKNSFIVGQTLTLAPKKCKEVM